MRQSTYTVKLPGTDCSLKQLAVGQSTYRQPAVNIQAVSCTPLLQPGSTCQICTGPKLNQPAGSLEWLLSSAWDPLPCTPGLPKHRMQRSQMAARQPLTCVQMQNEAVSGQSSQGCPPPRTSDFATAAPMTRRQSAPQSCPSPRHSSLVVSAPPAPVCPGQQGTVTQPEGNLRPRTTRSPMAGSQVAASPLPEPVLPEQQGALLNGGSLGLHEEQGHQDGHHDHAARKEEEGEGLQASKTLLQQSSRLLVAFQTQSVGWLRS